MMEIACRDRLGVFNATFFKLWTCSMCYHYLFYDASPSYLSNGHQLVALPTSPHPPGLTVAADVDDPEVVNLVCSTLKGGSCEKWQSCCRAAEQCCQEQSGQRDLFSRNGTISRPYSQGQERTLTSRLSDSGDSTSFYTSNAQTSSESADWESSSSFRLMNDVIGSDGGNDQSRKMCPRTWDGFSCFRDTAAGQTVSISCPGYIDQSDPHARAHKRCTENGTWWRDTDTGQEWTDYTTCVQMDAFRTLYYVKVTCNAVSLMLLIPACIIFLCYKKLREQHRVQIHLHLFMSFILTNVGLVLWENLVYNDRIHNPNAESLIRKDTVGCKILYVLTRYAWTCNFCWMFLEGFHLHRLIVKAFETPKSILGYYVVGWGGPWIPVLVYVIIRAVRKDSGCWVHNIEKFEWIIYTPNLLCIAVNIFFLLSILRILLTQLTTHPNEPSNYRRALKATFVLIPLFGLQFIFVVYSPDTSHHFTHIYEIIAAVVKNSQGALVALIFCFFNKEVLSHLKQLRTRCHGCLSRKNHDLKGLSSHTYVMTERGVQGHNGVTSRSPALARGQYVAVTTQDGPHHGSSGVIDGNFV